MQKKYTMGVLIGNANSPYTMDLMKGILNAAEQCNVNLIFYLGIHTDSAYRASFGSLQDKDDYEYQFNVVYDYVEISNVDALIVSFGTISHFLEDMTQEEFMNQFSEIPYVMVEEEDLLGKGSSVTVDNYRGMFEIVEHLANEHKCKDFLYLSGPKGTADADQRRNAFLDVMKKYGLPMDSTRIAYGDYTAYVTEQVQSLLDAHPDADALVCANDLMADCAYRECRRRGIRVGTDIAVTGYDDWENAAYMIPPLSTVFQNAERMGYQALMGAIRLCEGYESEKYLVPAGIKLRASCGCKGYDLEIMPEDFHEAYWMGELTPETERYVVMSRKVKAAQEQHDTYKQETWLLPLISREMLTHVDNEQEFFRAAMVRLAAFRIKRCYLYLFENPICHTKNTIWKCPEKMYLAACQGHGEIQSFEVDKRPVITAKEGIVDLIKSQGQFNVQVYVLFSNEIQYGILVTEITPKDIALSYQISMQISNALKFLEISKEQKRTMVKLEHLVQEINEKNEVLNFISENDAMTHCLNRRGFMEAVMKLNREKIGQRAALVFADLDHLKEINDSFGHSEGDFAICRISDVLCRHIGKSGFVGRIGGDEFVAVILEDEIPVEEMILKMKEENLIFNMGGLKNYYINASFGVQKFVCSENLSISDLLDGADVDLYRNKKNRRKSVRKD